MDEPREQSVHPKPLACKESVINPSHHDLQPLCLRGYSRLGAERIAAVTFGTIRWQELVTATVRWLSEAVAER